MNIQIAQCLNTGYLPGDFMVAQLPNQLRRKKKFGWNGSSKVRDRGTGWYETITPSQLYLHATLGEQQLILDLSFFKHAWGRLTTRFREAIAATTPQTLRVTEINGEFIILADDLYIWLENARDYHTTIAKARAKESARRCAYPPQTLKEAKREWKAAQKEVTP